MQNNYKKNNNDKRSYRQNSDKLFLTSFKKNFTIEDAIIDIKNRYNNKSLKILPSSYTVSWMKQKRIK